jgi:hypothetical protein
MSCFTVAKPLERDEFLKLYQKVSFLTKVILAPLGLHDQYIDLLGREQYLSQYTTIYQQIEDILSKCIFRSYGYDDDRIVATMHKFVGQSQDRKVSSLILLVVNSNNFDFALTCRLWMK